MPSSHQVGQSLFVFPITRYVDRHELARRSAEAAADASTSMGGGGGGGGYGGAGSDEGGGDADGDGGDGNGGGGMSFWQLARRVAAHGELLIGYQLRADGAWHMCFCLLYFLLYAPACPVGWRHAFSVVSPRARARTHARERDARTHESETLGPLVNQRNELCMGNVCLQPVNKQHELRVWGLTVVRLLRAGRLRVNPPRKGAPRAWCVRDHVVVICAVDAVFRSGAMAASSGALGAGGGDGVGAGGGPKSWRARARMHANEDAVVFAQRLTKGQPRGGGDEGGIVEVDCDDEDDNDGHTRGRRLDLEA